MTQDDSPRPGFDASTSFSALVLSLAAAALAYMGKGILPGTEKTEANLPLAKQTIDTIDTLKSKTAGNLTPDESKLLDDLLYELRLAYVQTDTVAPATQQKPA
jgi:hypothetical protein